MRRKDKAGSRRLNKYPPMQKYTVTGMRVWSCLPLTITQRKVSCGSSQVSEQLKGTPIFEVSSWQVEDQGVKMENLALSIPLYSSSKARVYSLWIPNQEMVPFFFFSFEKHKGKKEKTEVRIIHCSSKKDHRI